MIVKSLFHRLGLFGLISKSLVFILILWQSLKGNIQHIEKENVLKQRQLSLMI